MIFLLSRGCVYTIYQFQPLMGGGGDGAVATAPQEDGAVID